MESRITYVAFTIAVIFTVRDIGNTFQFVQRSMEAGLTNCTFQVNFSLTVLDAGLLAVRDAGEIVCRSVETSMTCITEFIDVSVTVLNVGDASSLVFRSVEAWTASLTKWVSVIDTVVNVGNTGKVSSSAVEFRVTLSALVVSLRSTVGNEWVADQTACGELET